MMNLRNLKDVFKKYFTAIGGYLVVPFLLLDQKIIAFAEKFAQWFQSWTGKDNFAIARWCLYGVPLTILVESIWEARVGKKGFPYLLVVNFIFFGYWLYIILYRTISPRLAENSHFRFSNPMKISPFGILFRTVLFFWMILNLSHLWQNRFTFVRELFLWLWVVFLSCDPLPPCLGKIREWIKSLFLKPAYDSYSG